MPSKICQTLGDALTTQNGLGLVEVTLNAQYGLSNCKNEQDGFKSSYLQTLKKMERKFGGPLKTLGVLLPFQNICRFDFSKFIYFVMHLDIRYIQMHSKQYESKKTKTTYILEWREYISKINEKVRVVSCQHFAPSISLFHLERNMG